MSTRLEEFKARADEMGKRWAREDVANEVPAVAALGAASAMVDVSQAITNLVIRAGGARTAEYLRLLADQAESLHVATSAPSANAS